MWYKSNINIEKLELLERQSNRAYYITQRHGNMWNLDRFDHPRCYSENSNPWNLAIRIIENNIGKSFNLSFSYYCKKVKVWHQYIFLDNFKDKYGRRSEYPYNDYIIDNNGLIQRNPNRWRINNYKRDYIIKTPNYKETTFILDTKTGGLKKEYPFMYWKKDGRYIEKQVITNGYYYKFDSKNDPFYKRLKAEQNKREKKANKLKKEYWKNYNYNFLTSSELKKKIDKKSNNLNILRHGFDLKTSFRKM